MSNGFWSKTSFPERGPPKFGGGRPQAPPRECFEGILWVLRTGARWKDLPKSFPSFTMCWRRFKS
ncbi:transposase [Polystyrenella longa]|uniref:transposase n=1 Tax=Polystyrenella longa TaxID=2528007 RepID=UPI0036F39B68